MKEMADDLFSLFRQNWISSAYALIVTSWTDRHTGFISVLFYLWLVAVLWIRVHGIDNVILAVGVTDLPGMTLY